MRMSCAAVVAPDVFGTGADMDKVKAGNWPLGINNQSQPDRLPDGAVRNLVNLDASPGGTLELRAPYRRVHAGALRACGAAGRKLITIGDTVAAYDPMTDSTQQLAGAVGPGAVACVGHNGELFISTPAETWRCDGARLQPWGVPEPAVSVSLIPGPLNGVVTVGVTALGAGGEESGVEPFVLTLSEQSIVISSNDSRTLRLYVSPPNHETLYYQGDLRGQHVVTEVRDDTDRLVTDGLRPFPACSMLASHHGVIVGALDRYVVMSEPMMPHLHDPIAGFFQYASPVNLLVATDGGVFIGTDDATYFLSGLETDPSQLLALNVGAIAGTGVALPDGRAAWFTRYGQAIGAADGSVALINSGKFSPDLAAQGAAGLIEHNGNQMLVTTMRGPIRTSGLGVGFHHSLEIDE